MPPSINTQQYHHHRLESGFIPRSPTSSPGLKTTHAQRTMSQEADAMRKRVGKACDRCRLKKSKCDGSSPCSRCKADNAICVFGERKKTHDKVYPKGYVEMLEQQQSQLVDGLQEMYKRLRAANAWSGPTLSEATGHPLTHDILAALNLLESKADGSGEYEMFEEDCSKLQHKLLADGAGYARRRASFSSESEHSQHDQQPQHESRKSSQTSVPTLSYTNSPSPISQSPRSVKQEAGAVAYAQALQQAQQQQMRHLQQARKSMAAPSPLQQQSPVLNDLPMYQTEWAFNQPDGAMENMMRSKYAMLTPHLQDGFPVNQMYEASQFEAAMALDGFNSNTLSPMMNFGGDFGFDPMELELNKYVAAP